MIINLIVLGDKLTAVYFLLSHDTLSVVGSYIIPEFGLPVKSITNLIKNKVTDKIVQIIISWVGLTILNPI